MIWLLQFQWPAGVALMLYGILTWADGIEPILGRKLSAYSEKTAPYSIARFLLGVLSGTCLHGKRGFLFCKRRYLAGLLAPAAAGIFAFGMAIGIFVPASIIILAPNYWAYPLLILGITIQLSCRAPTLRQTGPALLGLGCCWIGYTACRMAPLPPHLVSHGIAGLLVTATITHTPAAAFLALTAMQKHPTENIYLLTGIAITLGMCWLLILWWKLRNTRRPFAPPISLLSKFDLLFPERALQAALQENRRMAMGLASASRALTEWDTTNAIDPLQTVRDVERAMDEYKPAAQHYLSELTRCKLYERQARLLMFLYINIGDLERISDHLQAVAETLPLAVKRMEYPDPILQSLDAMLVTTAEIIDLLAHAMTGNRGRKQHLIGGVQEKRDQALQQLDHFTAILNDMILHKAIKPSKAIRMQDLRSHFERLIRHVRAIAIAGEQEDFWIEPDVIHERAIPLTRTRKKEQLPQQQIQALLQEQNT
ncbi:MAG: hypothetical protein ACNA71_08715 [Kiritimatiellia bacterium]